MLHPQLQFHPQAVSPKVRFFANQTFHFQTLRNAGYTLANCADLSEILETVKIITEGDVQSWYAGWKATSDRVLALAERTQDTLSKGGACMRASTYQRTSEFLLPPDDPKRPQSFDKTCSYFLKGLDTLGVPYELVTVPYGTASLRALYYPGPQGAEMKPLLMFGGGFDTILEEYYPNFAEAAFQRGYSVLTYEGPGARRCGSTTSRTHRNGRSQSRRCSMNSSVLTRNLRKLC